MGISDPQRLCGISRFLCEGLAFSLERIVVHWVCKLLLHTHESCWTAEGGCRYAGVAPVLTQILTPANCFPYNSTVNKERVLCRSTILPLAAAESSICRAAPCCAL